MFRLEIKGFPSATFHETSMQNETETGNGEADCIHLKQVEVSAGQIAIIPLLECSQDTH